MIGDLLARGDKSATFYPQKVDQQKWDAIFLSDEKFVEKWNMSKEDYYAKK